jgi:hypothetical protein
VLARSACLDLIEARPDRFPAMRPRALYAGQQVPTASHKQGMTGEVTACLDGQSQFSRDQEQPAQTSVSVGA